MVIMMIMMMITDDDDDNYYLITHKILNDHEILYLLLNDLVNVLIIFLMYILYL